MTLPVTIIIRTLNEENNIGECIAACKKNLVDEIIVVDGGSTDRTVEIAKEENVHVVASPKGLARQRDAGLKQSNPDNTYVAIVDADDRLDKNCIRLLIADLERNGADAVQARHDSYTVFSKKPMGYWENAMLVNLAVIHRESRKSRSVNMIGRPALYRRDRLMAAVWSCADEFTTASEDADLSYKLIKNGAKFTYGTGVTYRKHLDSFPKLFKRWLSYGSGDAKFILAHKERVFHVLFHLLINYPVVRFIKAVKMNAAQYTPFFIGQGLVRFLGMLKFFISGIGKTDDYKE